MNTKTRRIGSVAAVAVATALVITGCSGGGAASTSKSTSAPAGGNLIIDDAQDAVSMNPTTTFDNTSLYIMEQIMQPLFTVTKDGKGTQPDLATGYTISSDKKTYTISLRKNVKFSNGQPMTSKDVKFSLDADTATGNTGWGYINGAISSISTPDPDTVVIQLKHAWSPLIADLSLFSNSIVPYNYAGQSASEFYTHPIGTGPFKWDFWNKGRSLKVVKNTDYWQPGLPKLDSVTWNVVPDDNTRKLQLQGGQADIDALPTWATMNSLKGMPGIDATSFPSTEIDYIGFNEQKAPFNDVHVRQAISAAIDRKSLVSAALFGHGTPANSLLMPGVPYYDAKTPGIQYDLAAAKKDMAESSVPNGFTVNFGIQSGNSEEATIGQIVQSELQKIGITVKIQQIDPTTLHAQVQAGQYEMAISIWTMDIPDPDEWVTFAVNPTGGAHSAFTYYNNPSVIALAQQGEQTTTSSARQTIYTKLQDQVAADAPMAWMFYVPYAYPTSSKVHGFYVTPLGNYPLQDVSLSK
ncbi:ABC transporter substrate-binding protein [Gryllotalpicola reticulitermitis]|uniref:ABC transporter substrate-binding protein n=1 Tax=Gryllotalpicola reticulitermitis TaxID=1184153 RepID=A0ABV8Q2P2_9MICO